MIIEITLIIISAMAIGYFIRVCIEVRKDKPTDQYFSLHCFQCGNDMPVVEKKGNLYCKNCGLIHKNDYK
jgi:transcription elongation factor Elf1